MKAIIPLLLVVATLEYITRPNQEEKKEFTIQDELDLMDEIKLNETLSKMINEEKFELACVIRDYMNKKSIKIKIPN